MQKSARDAGSWQSWRRPNLPRSDLTGARSKQKRPLRLSASSIAEIALRPLLLSPSSRSAIPAAQVLNCVGCADLPLKSNKSSGLVFSTRHSSGMRVDATAFLPFSYF